MRIKTFFFLGLFLSSIAAEAQVKDTISIMTYNLLYYREITSFCTASNNSVSTKETAMETIVDFTLPDIIVVNEMGGSSVVNAFRLASNSLNQNGRNYYSFANFSGSASQGIVNMIYYDNRKFVLESQTLIDEDKNNNPLVRVIDIYTLRYIDTNLAIHQDTTHIHVIAAHLKAGNTATDRAERALATDTLMAYLAATNASGNYVMAGDFNLYNSNEAGYQNLINYSVPAVRFYDPINVPGPWSNDSRFAITHTQSTRTTGGCAAGGGMDDRFDFILASDEIMNNTDKMRYIPNTYKALGQDGNRFNGSITNPTNNSVPTAVSQALFTMSDHLPVLMDVEVSLPLLISLDENSQSILSTDILFQNPSDGRLSIRFKTNHSIQLLEVQDLSGRVVARQSISSNNNIEVDLSFLSKGTYFLRFTQSDAYPVVKKWIKL